MDHGFSDETFRFTEELTDEKYRFKSSQVDAMEPINIISCSQDTSDWTNSECNRLISLLQKKSHVYYK